MALDAIVRWALLISGLWGFLEVTLTYVTGIAPASEVFEILATPIATAILFYLSLGAVARWRPIEFVRVLMASGSLLPAFIYALRGRPAFTPFHAVLAFTPLALGLSVFLVDARKGRLFDPPNAARTVWIWLLTLWAGLAFTLRIDLIHAITISMVLLAAACSFAGVAVAALALRVWPPRGGIAAFSVLILGALIIAVLRGSSGPSLERQRDAAIQKPGDLSDRTNVVLIVLDTVRADHLDLYGYERPTLARSGPVLREGLVFDRATAAGSFSLSSHASLFTGLLPSAHGAQPILGRETTYGRLWPDVTTLAHDLSERGYRTMGVSANDVFLADWTGLQKGFDSFASTGRRQLKFIPLSMLVRTQLLRRRLLNWQWASPTWSAAEVTDAAIDRVSTARQPFFLFLNYFDAHAPHAVMEGPSWAPTARTAGDAYDTEIAYIDVHLSRLFEFLKSRGELDRTLIIVTSDHGEYFREKRLKGHPGAVYEPGTHVPLIVRLPGLLPGGRTLRRTGLIEVRAVVRDILDRKPIDWLTQSDDEPRILSEAWSLKDAGKGASRENQPTTTAVFAGDMKLIHRLSGRFELFDLSADPAEENNLVSSTEPAIVAVRERLLRQVNLRAPRGPAPAQGLSDDAKERLRALGYLR